jgi:hypothetical protein
MCLNFIYTLRFFHFEETHQNLIMYVILLRTKCNFVMLKMSVFAIFCI